MRTELLVEGDNSTLTQTLIQMMALAWNCRLHPSNLSQTSHEMLQWPLMVYKEVVQHLEKPADQKYHFHGFIWPCIKTKMVTRAKW